MFRLLSFSFALLALLVVCDASDAAPANVKLPWTVETSIGVRYIVDPADPHVGNSPARPILPSPDGTKFAVVTRRGDLARDENIFELLVFDTREVRDAIAHRRRPPRATHSLLRSSTTSDPAIYVLEWSPDGSKLRFNGVDNDISTGRPNGTGSKATTEFASRARYEWDLSTNNVTLICPCWKAGSDGSFPDFLLDAVNGRALYFRSMVVVPSDRRVAYPSQVFDQADFRRVQSESTFERRQELYFFSEGQSRLLASTAQPVVAGAIPPHGDIGVVVMSPASNRVDRYTIFRVNLANGALTPLLDYRTTSGQPSLSWSPDGSRVLIVSTKGGAQADEASASASIVVLDPASGNAQTIVSGGGTNAPPFSAQWTDDGARVAVRGSRGDQVEYEFIENTWRGRLTHAAGASRLTWETPRAQGELLASAEQRALGRSGDVYSWLDYPEAQPLQFSNGLALWLEENADTPQRLCARVGDHSDTLIDQDTRLRRANIAASRSIEWTTPDGRMHRGLLTMPVTMSATPPPLVIQLYYYMPNVFRPDGPGFQGYSRQTLAARGIAVLEIALADASFGSGIATIDVDREMNVYIGAAIAHLLDARLADPERLGVIGWSRGGYHSRRMLVDPPGRYRLRAAVTNDGAALTWAQFVRIHAGLTPNSFGIDQYTRDIGAGFWTASERWSHEVIDVGANRATGALLEIRHTDDIFTDSRDLADIVGPLRSAHRPAEAIGITNARHILDRPKHRYASLSVNVDWMDFWLNGHERTTPSVTAGETADQLREQYRRWRIMRDQWELQQAWEAAGNPPGSTPDPKFQIPETATKH